MMYGNPAYSAIPETPPGFASIPYTLGTLAAPFVGGVVAPYIPANQSTYDAWLARHVNSSMYNAVLQNISGQFGYQFGNTLGHMRLLRQMASRSGYDIAQMQNDLSGVGRDIGRSSFGPMLMAPLDAAMSWAGIYNGSMVDAASAAFNNRMNLLPAGTLMNPYSQAQQHMMMSGTSAILNALNGMMSRKEANGKLSLLTDPAFTRGFDRSTITNLTMMLAGAGGLSGPGGNIVEQYNAALGGRFDIAGLDYAAGDYTGGGPDSNIRGQAALKVKDVTDKMKGRIDSAVEAIGALRDLIKVTDNLPGRLIEMTGSEWLSGNSSAATTASLRRLSAITQAYNLNPAETWKNMLGIRDDLRAAAMGGPEQAALSKYYGFDGGGMFRLGAQTELIASIADRIRARGADKNPILAEGMMRQGIQAMARNMNTQAGVAVQLLAYGRQTGILSEQDAERIRTGITSGNRSEMERSVNDLLVMEFGSTKKGRQMMQDQMFINSIQQRLTDESGQYAFKAMITGADREWMRQEKVTAAADRSAFSRDIMSKLGMSVKPTAADFSKLVESVQATLRKEDGGDVYADAFGEQYSARIKRGMSNNAAFYATVNAFKNNPVTARYAENISLAIDQTMATQREAAIRSQGLESGQAKAIADSLRSFGIIDGKQYSAIQKTLRSGNGKGALSTVDGIVAGLSDSQRKLFGKIRDNAATEYNAAIQTIDDKKEVGDLLDLAGKSLYGSEAVVGAFNSTIAAARKYLSGKRTADDFVDFQDELVKNRFANIFGNDRADQLLRDIKGPNAEATIKKMGRQSIQLQQLATANLRSKGYDQNYSGIWGFGAYAGNSDAAAKERDDTIKEIVAISTDKVKEANGGRTQFGEDLVDFLTGNKNFKELIRIHDRSGILLGKDGGKGIVSDYAVAMSDFESAQSTYLGSYGAIRDAKKLLNNANRFEAAKELDALADSPGSKAIEDFLAKNGDIIDEKSRQKLIDALGKRQKVIDAQARVKETLKGIAKDERVPEILQKLKSSMAYDKTREGRYDDAVSYMSGLDAEQLVKEAVEAQAIEASGTKNNPLSKATSRGEAYLAAIKAVSDKEVADRRGYESLDNVNPYESVATRMEILKEQAMGGNKTAMEAMRKISAVSNEGTQKIRGEITIKDGKDQYDAILEGNMGGIS